MCTNRCTVAVRALPAMSDAVALKDGTFVSCTGRSGYTGEESRRKLVRRQGGREKGTLPDQLRGGKHLRKRSQWTPGLVFNLMERPSTDNASHHHSYTPINLYSYVTPCQGCYAHVPEMCSGSPGM